MTTDAEFKFTAPFLKELDERGFIKDVTDRKGLNDEVLSKGKDFAGYIGFDATAASLHAGSLFMLRMLHILMKHGHKAVVIIGGTTTRFGDPTGKDKERPNLDTETIEKNSAGIVKVIKQVLPELPNENIVNNNDWFSEMDFVKFFTEIGDKFSINDMVTKDVVKSRLDSNNHMSFKEFSYMLMQGFDFMKLNECKGVTLQMGGSDQWSNVLSGIELTRKKASVQLFGLTSPLLKEGGTDRKMGKSSDGKTIWLNEENTNSFDFWQFFRNTDDKDVNKFLKLFTSINVKDIDATTADMKDIKAINDAKVTLADAVTAFVHGKVKAEQAKEAAQGNDKALPIIIVDKDDIRVVEALVKAGFCSSNSEARRKIKEGAVRLDNVVVGEPQVNDLDGFDLPMKLSFGKKKAVMLRSK